MAQQHGQMWIWVDGAPQPASAARVPVLDRGFLYGDSIYEVTRTVAHKPLFWEAHLARPAQTAAELGFAPPPRAHIDAALAETLAAAAPAREFYIRVIVTRGAGALDLDPTAATEGPRLLVLVKPLKLPDPRLYREGAALATVTERRNAPGHVPPAVKSGNYLSSVLALRAARQRGAYEALMSDLDGYLAEGASSNLFIVRGGRLCTPPLSVGMLAGITRAALLRLAADHQIPVDEVPITLPEALAADEALLTSSIRGVMPVTRIDDHPIGPPRPGPLTHKLMQLYGHLIGEAPPGEAWFETAQKKS